MSLFGLVDMARLRVSIVGSFGGQNQVEMRFKSQVKLGGTVHAIWRVQGCTCMVTHSYHVGTL